MNPERMSGAERPARGRANVVRVAIVGARDLCRDQIVAALAEMAEPLVELTTSESTSGGSKERSPDVVIAALGEDRETWALQVQDLIGAAARPALIAAITDRSAEAVRQAMRAGVDDVFFLPVEASDLSRCLVRVCEARQSGAAAHHGIVCALGSVAGGVGVSTLTVALGFALRRLDQRRVALVDLGMQSGALAALLDLNPEHTLGELADPTTPLDSLRLEASLTPHASGLYLLAAPKRIEEGEMVSAQSVVAVLEVMRELFDFILIDCGHHMNETLVAVWEHSSHLLYPIEQSVSSVRPAQRFLEMFGRLGLSDLDLQFILNRYTSANPFTIAKIEAALHRPIAARIPRDDETFVQFQLGGEDLATTAPRSPARLVIDHLAREIAGMPAVSEAATGASFRTWLRAMFKQPLAATPPDVLANGRRPDPASPSGL
jgi:pilus assembly protein CpaE